MRFLITAGPTREPIDAVRFISNRSTGKMGLAIARAGLEAGHQVTLLLGPGPGAEQVPPGCICHRFESAAELKQLIEAHWPDHQRLVMAAAVSDWRPAQVEEGKMPRERGRSLTLHLQATQDLVALAAGSRRAGQKVVAFALEEMASLKEHALEKLKRKGVDAIVANPLGAMESDAVTAIWLTAGGVCESPERLTKTDFARWLIPRIEKL